MKVATFNVNNIKKAIAEPIRPRRDTFAMVAT
jgi:hypothetical protein